FSVGDASVVKTTSWHRGTSGGIKNPVRRPLLATALASLLAAALLVPTAQAFYKTTVNRFFQEDALNLGRASVLVNVVHMNRHRNGRWTPRVVYIQVQVPVSCEVGGNTVVTAASGPFKLRKGKVQYTDSFFYSEGFSFSVTGQKKKKRFDGTVTAWSSSSSPTPTINCTSGGPLPFFATPCQWFLRKPSLPVCKYLYPYGPSPIEGDEGPIIIPENPPPPVSGS
ncbi:MAG: hypothetical protein ACXWZ3_11860, partial [Solirubrobacterales bacterium]